MRRMGRLAGSRDTARIAFLRDVLGADHPVYKFEVLESIRGQSAAGDIDQGGQRETTHPLRPCPDRGLEAN